MEFRAQSDAMASLSNLVVYSNLNLTTVRSKMIQEKRPNISYDRGRDNNIE
jgi:hypothetical protein